MTIDLINGRISGLPANYAEVTKLAKKYAHAFRKREMCAELWMHSSDPRDVKAFNANSAKITEFSSLFLSTFLPIFRKDLASGNFEIFKTPHFLGFLASNGFQPIFKSFVETSPAALEMLMTVAEEDPSQAVIVAGGYHSHLSATQIQRLWELFKSHLDTQIYNWNTDLMIRTKGETPERSILDRQHLVVGLEVFGRTLDAPSTVLQEVLALAWDNVKLSLLKARLDDSKGVHFSAPIEIKDYPRIFKQLQPEAFEIEIQKSGVDPAVIETLLPSWPEDLESLLISASSLSADSQLSV